MRMDPSYKFIMLCKECSFACPEAATTLAGLKKALRSGLVGGDERVVLVDTGSGLKSVPTLPEVARPRIESVADVMG